MQLDNGLFTVVEFQHVKPGKGGAFVRTKLRNARTGAVIDRTFNAGIRIEQAIVEKRDMQYLYADGDGYVLNGQKAVVLQAASADIIVLSARSTGARRDRAGVSLFVVAAGAAGISRRDYHTVDEQRASELTLTNVRVGTDALLGSAGAAADVLERLNDEGAFAVAAEAVGMMEVLYKSTVDYTKQRQQFGQPISQFQVLQHRMVDMFMEYELSKSLLLMAAMRLAKAYDDTARRAVSALKVQVGKSGRFVAQNAVQLHGGMGMTEELAIGHYFKRMTVIDAQFGNVDHHLRRFGSIAA